MALDQSDFSIKGNHGDPACDQENVEGPGAGNGEDRQGAGAAFSRVSISI
jgi:hypothetical protein